MKCCDDPLRPPAESDVLRSAHDDYRVQSRIMRVTTRQSALHLRHFDLHSEDATQASGVRSQSLGHALLGPFSVTVT